MTEREKIALELVAEQVSRYQLWDLVFQKFDVAYKSIHDSQFLMHCKKCRADGFCLIFDRTKSGCHFHCGCNFSANDCDFVDLIELQGKTKKLNRKIILDGVKALLKEKQAQLKKEKAAAEKRAEQYGVFSFTESRVVKPTKPRKSAKVKPVQPVRKTPKAILPGDGEFRIIFEGEQTVCN